MLSVVIFIFIFRSNISLVVSCVPRVCQHVSQRNFFLDSWNERMCLRPRPSRPSPTKFDKNSLVDDTCRRGTVPKIKNNTHANQTMRMRTCLFCIPSRFCYIIFQRPHCSKRLFHTSQLVVNKPKPASHHFVPITRINSIQLLWNLCLQFFVISIP